jgi:hypothetical protein
MRQNVAKCHPAQDPRMGPTSAWLQFPERGTACKNQTKGSCCRPFDSNLFVPTISVKTIAAGTRRLFCWPEAAGRYE